MVIDLVSLTSRFILTCHSGKMEMGPLNIFPLPPNIEALLVVDGETLKEERGLLPGFIVCSLNRLQLLQLLAPVASSSQTQSAPRQLPWVVFQQSASGETSPCEQLSLAP